MISVLIPSRGREKSLTESADTLLSLAASPDEVEILAAIDIAARRTLSRLLRKVFQ